MRKDIQETVKLTCQKDLISKKDFLTITNQYEKLINRIVFSEMVGHDNHPQCFPSEDTDNEGSMTFRVEEKPKGKVACPGLSLNGIRKKGIEDYQDEFMAHYD